MSTVLKVENLDKIYRLGEVGTGTLSHDLNRWWHLVRGKEDPYAKVGQVNNRESKSQSDYVYALKDINFDVQQGEVLGVIGRNGAGKSTTFNLISGRFPVSAGSISLNGSDITNKEPQVINRLGLSRSFQITNIFPKLSVFENLRCSVLWALGYRYSFFRRMSALNDVRESAEKTLTMIGLENRREKMAGELTYAEQRALEIGITIASGANVILLDEPTAGMSRSETDAAVALIHRVTEGKTLLMVEHDMGVVFNIADRISVLVYGQVIATGTPNEIRMNKKVQEAYLGSESDEDGEVPA